MSWGIVERVRDKNYVAPSIDEILAGIPEVQKSTKSVWPFVEENDQHILDWLPSIQPRTDVQVSCYQLCNRFHLTNSCYHVFHHSDHTTII